MREERYIETHIGEFLEEEFLKPLNLTQNALAIAIHVPNTRIHEILKGRRRITVGTDLRLCKFFGLREGYFINIQNNLERLVAKREMGKDLNTIIPYEERKNDYAKI